MAGSRSSKNSDGWKTDDVEKGLAEARNLNIIVWAFIFACAGAILYFVFKSYAEAPTYKNAGFQPGKPLLLRPQPKNSFLSALPDFGIALFSVGAVGIVFELLNASARDRLLKIVVARITENLGEKLGERLTALVLADTVFVQEVLSDAQRRQLLGTLIQANIASTDSSAGALASSTSDGLAGRTKLERFEVEYAIRPYAIGDSSRRFYSEYRQTFTTNEQPSRYFKFHFEVVLRIEDAQAQAQADGDVFHWRYWLDQDEEGDSLQTLHEFDVEKIIVNTQELTRIEAGSVPESERHSNNGEDPAKNKWLYYYYDNSEQSETYDLDTRLKIPVSGIGSLIYVQPRKLAQGMHVSCDFPPESFTAAPIEALGCPHVHVDQNNGHQVVRTNDWVAPGATVAFVFFPNSKNPRQGDLFSEIKQNM